MGRTGKYIQPSGSIYVLQGGFIFVEFPGLVYSYSVYLESNFPIIREPHSDHFSAYCGKDSCIAFVFGGPLQARMSVPIS